MAAEPQRRSRRNADLTSSPPSPHVVWVGSLKNTVSEADLYNAFSTVGTVQSCKIKRDETGASR